LTQVGKWAQDGFGLAGAYADAFFPLAAATSDAASHAHAGWAHARRAAATGACPSVLAAAVPGGGRAGVNLRVVLAKKKAHAAAANGPAPPHHDHCALLAFAYLAAQPEVRARRRLHDSCSSF